MTASSSRTGLMTNSYTSNLWQAWTVDNSAYTSGDAKKYGQEFFALLGNFMNECISGLCPLRFYFNNWHGTTEGDSPVWRHCVSKLKGRPAKTPEGTPLLDAASLDYLFSQVLTAEWWHCSHLVSSHFLCRMRSFFWPHFDSCSLEPLWKYRPDVSLFFCGYQGQHDFQKGLVPLRTFHSEAEQHDIENECLGMAVLAITYYVKDMDLPNSNDVR